jgi:hypothetical protein
MMGTAKLGDKASRRVLVAGATTGAGALGILIIGVLLLIAGCGPPI